MHYFFLDLTTVEPVLLDLTTVLLDLTTVGPVFSRSIRFFATVLSGHAAYVDLRVLI